ncbi:LysR family transcriptional regulator [Allopusillimonas ginsengisoli]|uniref:LysR family transcriptional regulator n=1 Tax=Allopusillimonas ginsengisoli TaxID=453575 RepID=UPI001021BEF7|nr:LysR substrate-binding domain-containing protein [Allopusillimonas ginsengisoli]TEA79347.1 LysR family transcriptional regulator [Allopusillimonas ginsengisoli]
MRLRHIELIDAILRTGSLTQAAALLHISQPAASKVLAHAETHLGYALFVRVKGRLHPTPELEALTPHIARVKQDMTAVRRLADNLKLHPQGHLRIGCAPALGLGLLPQTVHATRTHRPGIVFDIHTYHSAELVEHLQVRELDLAITFDAAEHPGLERTVIGHTELVFLGPAPTQSDADPHDTASTPIRLQDLPAQDLIVLDMHDHTGALLEAAMADAGQTLQARIQVQTHYVACALALAGCGCTVVDALTARSMLRAGMMLRPLSPAIRVPISVLAHGSVARRDIETFFIEQLQYHCHVLSSQGYPTHTAS